VLRLADGARITLEATPVRRTIRGRTFVMYGFNGQYPGPLIQVAQGATITVDFRNGLDMPSAIHWHGVRLENRFDGTPGVTQDPVAPGASFTYRVHFKDAGLYWYHPHVREDIQQDLGLYGNMLVDPPSRDYYGPANRQEIWMLDDLLMTDDGRALVPYGAEQPTHALMGRFGNVFLVNGEPDRRLRVRRGEVVRFFFTNVSNTRLYNLSFGGAPMKVVGSDVGKFEHEAWVTSIVLAPAERYIVDVQFTESGVSALTNRVQSLNHARGNFFAESHTLATIDVGSGTGAADDYSKSFRTLRRNVDVTADIDRFRPQFARAVDRTLVMTLRTRDLPAPVAGMMLGPTVPVDWNDGMPMENWLVSGREATWILREPETGRENMDVTWTFAQGDVVKLRFVNDASSPHPMSHPIHIHGQRFLVLARNGVANEHLVWKDTTIIAAGETVDVLLELSNPGRWMLHCHIAEHLGTGMMTVFEVKPSL
jgi:FtsP/CotA-like multicopper oxidase with cupredoxin domain